MDFEIKESGTQTIRKFKEIFLKEYGLELIIVVKGSKNVLPKVTLKELEESCDKMLHTLFPGKYPNGIKSKKRQRELVNFRYCFFKIAIDMGYTQSFVAKHMGFDHATVLYSNRLINNLLAIKDPGITFNYNLILNELQERLGIDADLRPDQPA